MKNKDISFGIIKDPTLAKKCGVTRLPSVLTLRWSEGDGHYEMRRSQFFDDMTIYFSDDKTRRVGLLKKDTQQFVDLRPRRPQQGKPKEEEL